MYIGTEHHNKIQRGLEEIYNLPLPEENEYCISFYLGGHDRAAVISKGRQVIEVIEFERFFNLKNGDFFVARVTKNYPTNSYEFSTENLQRFYIELIFNYIKVKYANVNFKYMFSQENLTFGLNVEKCIPLHHHSSHALGAFYQSPFNKALIFVYDGGSQDGVAFSVYHAVRGKLPKLITASSLSLVGRYHNLGMLFDCIKYEPEKCAMSLPGKLMALSSFGKPNLDLLSFYKSFITSAPDNEIVGLVQESLKELKEEDYFLLRELKAIINSLELKEIQELKILNKNYIERMYHLLKLRLLLAKLLLDKENITNSLDFACYAQTFIGFNVLKKYNRYKPVDMSAVERLDNNKSFEISATVQKACEELVFEKINPFLEKYKDLPIVLSGGGALNIILNTKIKKETGRSVFVGPDPSDCGLALGAMLSYLRPDKPYSDPYTGMPILDINSLGYYMMEYVGVNSDLSKYTILPECRDKVPYIAKLISEGKILGIIRNNSERGPRALGNRSIICSASIPGIKDTLNFKVKFREWFRPFAPVVRLEDISKYFDWEGESRYMNFCIDVKEEYKEKLEAITHVDGTARVQTITRQQNWFLYDILTELDKLTGIGVTVNTSFNVNGKPLINTVKDAFYMLENTQLDGVIIQNTLILKK